MKKLLAAIIMLGGLLLSYPSAAEVVDKIEVIVNDEMITRREIDRLLAPIYEKYKTMYDGEKLIYGEAKKLNMNVDDKEVDEKIQAAISKVGGKEEFNKAIAAQQVTMKELRVRYKEQAMSRRVIEQKVGSKVTITPVEIENYYAKNIDRFSSPEEVSVRNIMIKPEDDPVKAANLATEISKRLKEGCDFGGLAKIYSQGPAAEEGGLMGYVKRGDLMPEIEDVIFKLKEGEVSGIVQTQMGYHIFKVEEKRQGKVRSLKEARRDVEEALFMEKMNQKAKAWVESLKKNAYIEIR
ncbi:MAG: peptidylprolyl isomerase [Candidatus Omnitrophica bacterium]|nr:peptidylprolyl isomerase [Candidatus Omnitrophota bacterium]